MWEPIALPSYVTAYCHNCEWEGHEDDADYVDGWWMVCPECGADDELEQTAHYS